MSTTVEHQLLDTAMKDCGEELELTIKILQQLSLDSAEQNPNIIPAEETVENNPSSSSNRICAEWAELIVNEMKNAGSLDDGRARAFRVLEAFQQSTASIRKEKEKESTEALTRQNSILKSAVVIQHKRLNEIQRQNEDLKQKLLQYQEELRNLKGENYWLYLSMHLKQAAENGAVSGSLRRSDVF